MEVNRYLFSLFGILSIWDVGKVDEGWYECVVCNSIGVVFV